MTLYVNGAGEILTDAAGNLCEGCCVVPDCSNTRARVTISGVTPDAVLCGDECNGWNSTYLLMQGGSGLLSDEGNCLAGVGLNPGDADLACQYSLSFPRCSYTYSVELAVWCFFGTGWLSMFGIRSPGSYDSGDAAFADEVVLYVADQPGNRVVEGTGQLLDFSYTFADAADLCGAGGTGQLECTLANTLRAAASIELIP